MVTTKKAILNLVLPESDDDYKGNPSQTSSNDVLKEQENQTSDLRDEIGLFE